MYWGTIFGTGLLALAGFAGALTGFVFLLESKASTAAKVLGGIGLWVLMIACALWGVPATFIGGAVLAADNDVPEARDPARPRMAERAVDPVAEPAAPALAVEPFGAPERRDERVAALDDAGDLEDGAAITSPAAEPRRGGLAGGLGPLD